MTEQLTIGDALKADGMARAEAGSDPWWRSCAWTAIETEAATGRVFQAYTLALRYGLDEPHHPNQWGALFGAARRAGLIESVGWAESGRPTTAKSRSSWRSTGALLTTWIGGG